MPGEIADMMLEGTLCECCGAYIGGEGEGFPRYCSPACAGDSGVGSPDRPRHPWRKAKTHQCPHCQKLLRGELAVRQHVAAKHPGA